MMGVDSAKAWRPPNQLSDIDATAEYTRIMADHCLRRYYSRSTASLASEKSLVRRTRG